MIISGEILLLLEPIFHCLTEDVCETSATGNRQSERVSEWVCLCGADNADKRSFLKPNKKEKDL